MEMVSRSSWLLLGLWEHTCFWNPLKCITTDRSYHWNHYATENIDSKNKSLTIMATLLLIGGEKKAGAGDWIREDRMVG